MSLAQLGTDMIDHHALSVPVEMTSGDLYKKSEILVIVVTNKKTYTFLLVAWCTIVNG
jgi:hypothetical protein